MQALLLYRYKSFVRKGKSVTNVSPAKFNITKTNMQKGEVQKLRENPESIPEKIYQVVDESVSLALNYHEKRRKEIKLLVRAGGCMFYELGCLLNDATKGKDYKHFGYDTAERYFEHEFSLSRSYAYDLINIAESYGKYFSVYPELLDCADVSKFVTILPVTRGKSDEETIEWIRKAKDLTVRGLRDCIKEHRGKIPTDGCEHPETTTITTETVQCKKCGLRLSHNKVIE